MKPITLPTDCIIYYTTVYIPKYISSNNFIPELTQHIYSLICYTIIMNLQDKSEPEIYDLFRNGTISEETAREHIENFDLKTLVHNWY